MWVMQKEAINPSCGLSNTNLLWSYDRPPSKMYNEWRRGCRCAAFLF